MNRAPVDQQRKALEIANLFVKMGIGFVPVPVASEAEYDRLTRLALDKLAVMEKLAEADPIGAQERKEP